MSKRHDPPTTGPRHDDTKLKSAARALLRNRNPKVRAAQKKLAEDESKS